MPTTEKHLESAMFAMHDATPQFIVQPILRQMAEAAIAAYLRSVLEDRDSSVRCICNRLRDKDRAFTIEGDTLQEAADLIESQAASLSSALERCAGMEKDISKIAGDRDDESHNASEAIERADKAEARLALVEPVVDAAIVFRDTRRACVDEKATVSEVFEAERKLFAALPQPQPAQPPLEDDLDGQ